MDVNKKYKRMLERFENSFTKDGRYCENLNSNCWEWNKLLTKGGYGRFSFDFKIFRAHRFYWELLYGKIPNNLFVCHKCDNPCCVNPDHLFLGTQTDNETDKKEKGRNNKGKSMPNNSMKGERNGNSKLKEDDIYEIKKLYDSGSYTFQNLADKYGVSNSAISSIVNSKSWRNLK